ncbi:Transcriptional regulatory protein QseF [Novipirellula aureliae]|uniref:Transcriptional regulatory protein QseF n=1 Tax=Novipirellula aureliae TaxID=2527966 RepID=A0A5C6EBV9_9BACT|nr:sigma-54 dependent transcriptional regulator [Novipirellula aureliae]TWU45016.1 Transcriptional regulatory protein QseF [Novipirellula aureliae]
MNQRPARILIADDEPLYRRTTGQLLCEAGYECECVEDADKAINALQSKPFDLILSDLNMPGNLKLELLHEGRRNWSHVPLIVITGVPSIPSAIESVRLGITDYLLKPVKYEDLISSVRRALSSPLRSACQTDLDHVSASELSDRYPELIGQSEPMQELLKIVDRVAQSDTSVLITGESGTGKEVVARAIHTHSRRAANNFQVIDCTAIPESLFESVLFGHAKGSFTGAVKDQDGLLVQCDHGTAFFDELGELPAGSQAKLLRAIQEQTFTPVGKSTPVHVDTRFICATNRDLEAEVAAGRFRADLFYRLGVIHIPMPPLRGRGDDVVLLANHLLRQVQSAEKPKDRFSAEALDCLKRYSWPGNIRELRNAIERSVVLAESSVIEATDLPPSVQKPNSKDAAATHDLADASREEALDQAEQAYLKLLLKKHDGNVSQSAQQAGLSRQAMHSLLKKHRLDADDYR